MSLKTTSLRKPVTTAEFFLRWEWILGLLILIAVLVSAILSPYFLNARNLLDMTFNFLERGIMALTMTFVIMTGNIDLSVASNLAMTAAIMGRLFAAGLNIWVAAAIGLVIAGLAGMFNGLIITRFKLPALVATLGTYVLYRGVAWILLEDGAVTGLPANYTALGQGYIPGTAVPIQLALYVVLAIPAGLILHRTIFGRLTYALGNSKEACRYSGVNINRVLLAIFTASGLMAGVAGLLMEARFASVRADIGQGAELDVITMVVLGGVDINGGSGTMPGVVLAMFLLGIVRYGMNLLNVPPQSQIIFTGFLLMAAIILPQVVRRVATQASPAGEAGDGRATARGRMLWVAGGLLAVVVVVAAIILAQCAGGGPQPGAGQPVPVASGTASAQAAATEEEVVLPATPTSVQAPPTPTPRPTRTPRPTATQGATATSAPTVAASATTQAAAGAAGAGPTSTNIPTLAPPPAPPTAAPASANSDRIEIPAGSFIMGADDGNGNETPKHNVDLPAFLIDHLEVSNDDFSGFVEATGYQTEAEKSGAKKTWRSFATPDKANHPVVKVTFADAQAYCQWAGGRLPTEAEWEKAARGTDGRAFPWGNLWDTSLANVKLSGIRSTVAVGSYPGGASPYGVEDMAGNVAEWTDSPYIAYPGSGFSDPQYRQEARTIRGGGWFDDQKQVRTSARNGALPNAANDDLGFRCAADKK